MGLSVANIGGISPVGGIGSMDPITAVSRVKEQRPEALTVDNEAEVSDAFAQSLAVATNNRVNAAPPVVYPTAQVQTNEIAQVRRSQEVNGAYNSIAASFNGMSTGYDANSNAASYGMIGSMLDVYA